MELPETLMRRLRGPLLAAAVAGCSGSPATVSPSPAPEIAPDPAEPPAIAADPVPYDLAEETARLARRDRALASAAHRRERRIEDEDRARLGAASSAWIGAHLRDLHAGCGRG